MRSFVSVRKRQRIVRAASRELVLGYVLLAGYGEPLERLNHPMTLRENDNHCLRSFDTPLTVYLRHGSQSSAVTLASSFEISLGCRIPLDLRKGSTESAYGENQSQYRLNEVRDPPYPNSLLYSIHEFDLDPIHRRSALQTQHSCATSSKTMVSHRTAANCNVGGLNLGTSPTRKPG